MSCMPKYNIAYVLLLWGLRNHQLKLLHLQILRKKGEKKRKRGKINVGEVNQEMAVQGFHHFHCCLGRVFMGQNSPLEAVVS